MKNGSLLFSRLLCCNEAARETGESTNGALARLLAGIKSGRSCQRNGKLFFDRPMFGLNMRATCRVLATPSDRLLFHLIVRYVRYVQLSENGRTTNGRKWRMMIVSLFFFSSLKRTFPTEMGDKRCLLPGPPHSFQVDSFSFEFSAASMVAPLTG